MTPLRQSADARLRTLLLILALTALLMGALLALFPAAGHDQLWFLMMARRWLGGAELYGPQVFDSNPPGIVWASAVPVRLGVMLHVSATLPAKTLVLMAEAGSAWCCYGLLRRQRGEAPAFYAAGLLFAFVVLGVVVPARDFGQRDQMLSFLILPYVLAAVAPQAGWGLQVAAGGMAAVGICLKPQYAVIAMAVELFVLLRAGGWRRVIRPEPVLIVMVGIFYLGAIRHFAPLYFSEALPVLRETYWAVGHLSVPQLLVEAIELVVLAAIVVALYAFAGLRSLPVRVLLVAGGAAFAAYAMQGTGWYYQQIPALVLFGAALALELMDLVERHAWGAPGWALPAAATLGVLAVGLTTHFMGYPFTQDRAFAIEVPDPALFAGLPEGTPVAMLTTSVDAAMMPVERYRLTWAQRTNNLWTLPAILRGESGTAGGRLTPEKLVALEQMQHRWMVEDLQRWKPQMVLVQRCQNAAVRCQLLEDRNDDLLAWFKRDPAFVEIWKSYRLVKRSGQFDAYVLDPSGMEHDGAVGGSAL